MSNEPEVTTNDLMWLFSTLHEGMPGSYVDELARRLLQVPPGRWLEAVQIWKTGQQARRLDPEVVEPIARLALVWAGKKHPAQKQ